MHTGRTLESIIGQRYKLERPRKNGCRPSPSTAVHADRRTLESNGGQGYEIAWPGKNDRRPGLSIASRVATD